MSKIGGRELTHASGPGENKESQRVRVTLLDGASFWLELSKSTTGQELLDHLLERVNVKERVYFGLWCQDERNLQQWLDTSKPVRNQTKRVPIVLQFGVRFYPVHPHTTHPHTQFQLYRQVKKDLEEKRLLCSPDVFSALVGCVAQVECGDYSDMKQHNGYQLLFDQLQQEIRNYQNEIAEHHERLRGTSQGEALSLFLKEASSLEYYGMSSFSVWYDHTLYTLGLSPLGLFLCKDQGIAGSYMWAHVIGCSGAGSRLSVTIHGHTESEQQLNLEAESARLCKTILDTIMGFICFYRDPKSTVGNQQRHTTATQDHGPSYTHSRSPPLPSPQHASPLLSSLHAPKSHDFMSASHDLMAEMAQQHQSSAEMKPQTRVSQMDPRSQIQTQDPVLLALMAKRQSHRHKPRQHSSVQAKVLGSDEGQRNEGRERQGGGIVSGGMQPTPSGGVGMLDRSADSLRPIEITQPPPHPPAPSYTLTNNAAKPKALFKPRSSHAQEANLRKVPSFNTSSGRGETGGEIRGQSGRSSQDFCSSQTKHAVTSTSDHSATLSHSSSPQLEKKFAHHMVKSWVKQQKRREDSQLPNTQVSRIQDHDSSPGLTRAPAPDLIQSAIATQAHHPPPPPPQHHTLPSSPSPLLPYKLSHTHKQHSLQTPAQNESPSHYDVLESREPVNQPSSIVHTDRRSKLFPHQTSFGSSNSSTNIDTNTAANDMESFEQMFTEIDRAISGLSKEEEEDMRIAKQPPPPLPPRPHEHQQTVVKPPPLPPRIPIHPLPSQNHPDSYSPPPTAAAFQPSPPPVERYDPLAAAAKEKARRQKYQMERKHQQLPDPTYDKLDAMPQYSSSSSEEDVRTNTVTGTQSQPALVSKSSSPPMLHGPLQSGLEEHNEPEISESHISASHHSSSSSSSEAKVQMRQQNKQKHKQKHEPQNKPQQGPKYPKDVARFMQWVRKQGPTGGNRPSSATGPPSPTRQTFDDADSLPQTQQQLQWQRIQEENKKRKPTGGNRPSSATGPPSPTRQTFDDADSLPQTQQQLQWQRIQEENKKRKSQGSPPRGPPKSPPVPTVASSPKKASRREASSKAAHSPPASPTEDQQIPPPPPPFFPKPKLEVGRFEIESDDDVIFQLIGHNRKESIDSMASTAAVKDHPRYTGPFIPQTMPEVDEIDAGPVEEGGSQNLTDLDSDIAAEDKPLAPAVHVVTHDFSADDTQHLRVAPKRWHSEYKKKPSPLHVENRLSVATDDTSVPNSPSYYTRNPPMIKLGRENDPQSILFRQYLISLNKSRRESLVENWMQETHSFWENEPARDRAPPLHTNLPMVLMSVDKNAGQPAPPYKRKEHFYDDPDALMSSPASPTSPLPPSTSHATFLGRTQARTSATTTARAAPHMHTADKISPYAVVNKHVKRPQQMLATDV